MQISKTVLSPCKDCPNRFSGCHSSCSKYQEYKQKLESNRTKHNALKDEYEFRVAIKSGVSKKSKHK